MLASRYQFNGTHVPRMEIIISKYIKLFILSRSTKMVAVIWNLIKIDYKLFMVLINSNTFQFKISKILTLDELNILML